MKIFLSSVAVLWFTVLSGQNINPDFNEEYNQNYLATIEITMADSDFAWMIDPANIWSDTYQHVTAVYKGSNGLVVNYTDMGLRLRGNTSRSKFKKSFKLHFETYTPNQYFFGLKKLNLKAETNDPSLVREHLVMNMYRDVNIPVARVNHIKLYINTVYMGLYASIEQIDTRFVASRFGDDSGNLYKCSWGADLSATSNVYDDGIYELKTNETINDRTNLDNFATYLNSASTADFESHIGTYFNINTYIKQLAIEVLTGHWDGYSYNKNNYYLYFNPTKNWFEYIPYDTDNTLGIDWVNRDWSTRNIYDWVKHGGTDRPLWTQIMSSSKYKKMYSEAINELLNGVYNTAYQMPIAYAYQALIQSAVNTDTYYPLDFGFNYSDFQNSYTQEINNTHVKFGIEPFIDVRFTSATTQLDPLLLSLTEADLGKKTHIYPVPLTGDKVLSITTASWQELKDISIYNAHGQMVFFEHFESTTFINRLNLNTLKTGAYFIRINYKNDEKTDIQKLVVQ